MQSQSSNVFLLKGQSRQILDYILGFGQLN
jgi:hypothetical protein